MAAKRNRKAPGRPGRKTTSRSGARSRREPRSAQATRSPAPPGVVTIRKYANRRLYDTAASAHITQEDLYRMVTRGVIVRILDASTEEDITNQTLALALIEHDPGKLRLMPAWLLHQMIRLHEQALGGWMKALWQAFPGAAMPLAAWPAAAAWPAGGAAWPGAASAGLGSWTPWATAAGSPPGPASEHAGAASREEDLDDLRGEVSRLLKRLSELERRG